MRRFGRAWQTSVTLGAIKKSDGGNELMTCPGICIATSFKTVVTIQPMLTPSGFALISAVLVNTTDTTVIREL